MILFTSIKISITFVPVNGYSIPSRRMNVSIKAKIWALPDRFKTNL
jgi:hypothetical protein